MLFRKSKRILSVYILGQDMNKDTDVENGHGVGGVSWDKVREWH